jgi:hypothetical protein
VNQSAVRFKFSLVLVLLCATAFILGCKSSGSGQNRTAAARGPSDPNIITTAATNTVGRIAAVNAQARYVVVEFTPGAPLPQVEQRMNVYRGSLKVGELKITGPARSNNTAGDITAGDAAIGDAVKVD